MAQEEVGSILTRASMVPLSGLLRSSRRLQHCPVLKMPLDWSLWLVVCLITGRVTLPSSHSVLVNLTLPHHFSPLVPNELQANTSTINYWLEACGGSLEECQGLDPFYEVSCLIFLISIFPKEFHSHQALNQFRQDTPGAGAYFNEADYFEPGWQEQFWGIDNYNKLLNIKSAWDPEGLFTCYNCVGSESWDQLGMCRIQP